MTWQSVNFLYFPNSSENFSSYWMEWFKATYTSSFSIQFDEFIECLSEATVYTCFLGSECEECQVIIEVLVHYKMNQIIRFEPGPVQYSLHWSRHFPWSLISS